MRLSLQLTVNSRLFFGPSFFLGLHLSVVLLSSSLSRLVLDLVLGTTITAVFVLVLSRLRERRLPSVLLASVFFFFFDWCFFAAVVVPLGCFLFFLIVCLCWCRSRSRLSPQLEVSPRLFFSNRCCVCATAV